MSCLFPNTAYRSKDVNPATGKRPLVFSKTAAHSGIAIKVPCGQCINCRLDHARVWAIRLMKENASHDTSCFLTLTYDDEHLPVGGTLVRSDISSFCKRLHNRLLRARGRGIRFYYSGEYGETYGRPHYHALIFGFDFPDRKFYKRNKRGEPIYSSEFCRELWPAGRNGIGLVTFESAAYTAGYVVDKITGARADEYYMRVDADGQIFELEREFAGMSRRPGIGRLWFDKFHGETYRDDFIVVNGVRVRPPRYFDNLFEEIDSKRLSKLKSVRRRRALLHKADQTYDRRRVREIVAIRRLALRGKDLG